ncbi:MAG: CoB--CoM heterodisulfide reductase iron-sulfur subunit A family protein [Bacteroidales bacterium]|nr:CoB--CoM heterodisulfide reductase iron-sulfur subunit A family protein [Bacteroidales bacterium]
MEEQRIGVYVCWCGSNIAKMVDVEAVAEEIGKMPNVAISKNYKYMCSDPGQDLIVKDIKEHNLNRVVVSACSPRIHELTFRKALQNAGLNPYLFEMANIREHVSWVHEDREEATRKAKALVRAAVERVSFHEPLDKRTVDIDPATLIIGGGISGLCSALEIADTGNQIYLVEKSDKLGGHTAIMDLTFPHMQPAGQLIEPIIKRVSNHPNIEVFLNTTIDETFGYIGNFETEVQKNGKKTELKFGNIIVATGLKTFDPKVIDVYGYGKLPNVVTSVEFEQMLKSGTIQTKDGKEPKHIAIIHCVGSRHPDYHEYCSRTCCMVALKYANQLRSALPDSNIFDIYADMRAFGKKCEEFYMNTAKRNILFLNFDQQQGLPRIDMPQISKAQASDGCEMIIEMNERLSGEKIEVPADLVILMVGMEAHESAKEVAHSVGVSLCGNEFYIERHPKLDPVATTTDGVYIVGACQGPKDITDSVAQARAAAARILGTIALGQVEVELTTAVVNEDICCGCQTCVKVCPYTAISFDDEKNVSVVNEILCKGCGTCGSACPTGAIRSRHFTDKQIISQIRGLMHLELTEM